MKKHLFGLLMGSVFSIPMFGQVGINTSSPNVTLEVTAKKTDGSSSEGLIAPRLTGDALHQADLNNKYGALHDGSIAYVTAVPSSGNAVGQTSNIDAKGYYYYESTQNKWMKLNTDQGQGTISSLTCASATITGSVTSGVAASGVSASLPYTGGNGGSYSSQSVSSTVVTGLTATLSAGNLANGSGSVVYTITGTASGSGTAVFALTLGGHSCSLNVPVGSAGPVVTDLNCASANITGSLTSGLPASGVSASVPYTGGNGGSYSSQSVSSTGVTGLTATLSAGNLSNGSGSVAYTITGSPSDSGTANFAISLGGQSCSLSVTVQQALSTGSGSLSGKTCFDVVMVNDGSDCGTLASRVSLKSDFSQTATNTQMYTFTPLSGSSVSNVRFIYQNTNGTVIQSVSGGNFGNNITSPVSATVNYNPDLNDLASGKTRADALTAKIIVLYNNTADNTGADVQLTLTVSVQDCACCGALIAPGVWKNFMCQNLGADMTADPFVPSAAIQGAKYQWGAYTGEQGRYISQADGQSNTGAIVGWITSGKPIGSWLDTYKTANDPCPAGYRVPTSGQWQAVTSNNSITYIGTNWIPNATNYSTGIKFGDTLFLPASGTRNETDGILGNQGDYGDYWSSSPANDNGSGNLGFNNMSAYTGYNNRTFGFSIRCVSE